MRVCAVRIHVYESSVWDTRAIPLQLHHSACRSVAVPSASSVLYSLVGLVYPPPSQSLPGLCLTYHAPSAVHNMDTFSGWNVQCTRVIITASVYLNASILYAQCMCMCAHNKVNRKSYKG